MKKKLGYMKKSKRKYFFVNSLVPSVSKLLKRLPYNKFQVVNLFLSIFRKTPK